MAIEFVSGEPVAPQVMAVAEGQLKEGDPLFVGVRDTAGALGEPQVLPSGVGIELTFLDVASLPVGQYVGRLEIALCKDEQCAQMYPGSPFALPYRINVKPNIVVPAQSHHTAVSGSTDPINVAVSLPPEAADAVLSVDGVTFGGSGYLPYWVDRVEYDGATVRMIPKSLPPGTYAAFIELRKQGTPYRGQGRVDLVVTDPPGGATYLQLLSGSTFFALTESQTATSVLRFSRPSWSPAFSWRLETAVPWLQVRQTGATELELSVDTVPVGEGSYLARLVVEADQFSAPVYLDVRLGVGRGLIVYPTAYVNVGVQTPLSQATTAVPIAMADGSAERWTATTDGAPWLRLATDQGTTGVDDLRVMVDPAAINSYVNGVHPSTVRLAVDRPGVSPVNVTVTFYRAFPQLRSLGVEAVARGKPATLLLSGDLLATPANPFDPIDVRPYLTVNGATVRSAGDATIMKTIRVELDAVTGTGSLAVAIGSEAGVTTQLSVPIVNAPDVPAFGRSLPYKLRRAPVVSARGPSIWYGDGDRIERLRLEAGSWAAGTATVSGLLDFDLSPDGLQVGAAVPGGVQLIDAATLMPGRAYSSATPMFGGAAGHKLIAWSADDVLWLTRSLGSNYLRNMNLLRNDGLIVQHERSSDFVSTPALEPGYLLGPARNMVLRYGMEWNTYFPLHSSLQPEWAPLGSNVGVNDPFLPTSFLYGGMSLDGTRFVLADGQVQRTVFGVPPPALLVPPTGSPLVITGSTLSADGRRAWAYAHASDGQPGMLLSFDIPALPVLPDFRVQPTDMIPLPIAVGCVSPGPSTPCGHGAHVKVDLHERLVAVLGPQGFAIVPIDGTVLSARVTADRDKVHQCHDLVCRIRKTWVPRQRAQ